MGTGQTFGQILVKLEKWDGSNWQSVHAYQTAVVNQTNGTWVYNFPGTYAAGRYKATAQLYRQPGLLETGLKLVKEASAETTIQ